MLLSCRACGYVEKPKQKKFEQMYLSEPYNPHDPDYTPAIHILYVCPSCGTVRKRAEHL
jgi:rubredoxin